MSKVNFQFITLASSWMQTKRLTAYPWREAKFKTDEDYGDSKLNLSIAREDIDSDQFRRLKKLFGPFKYSDNFMDGKNASGVVNLDSFNAKRKRQRWESQETYDERPEEVKHNSICISVTASMQCEAVDPKTLTEQTMEDLVENIRNGVVKASICKPAIGLVREGEDIADEKFNEDLPL